MENIEEIEKLNDKISYRSLFFNKYTLKSKLILICLVLITSAIGIFTLINIFRNNKFYLLFPIVIILAIIYIRLNDYFRNKVIKEFYDYALNPNSKSNITIIKRVQKTELINLIKNENFFYTENLVFLIETLRNRKSNNHNFLFLKNAVMILSSVYLASVLGGVSIFSENIIDFFKTTKILGVLLITLLIVFWFIDKTMIKDFSLSNKRRKNRLLSTLENIYFEKRAKI